MFYSVGDLRLTDLMYKYNNLFLVTMPQKLGTGKRSSQWRYYLQIQLNFTSEMHVDVDWSLGTHTAPQKSFLEFIYS
jgi:hypothetical protein